MAIKRGVIKKKEVLEKLSAGREGAIQVRMKAKISSAEYEKASELLNAIDNLAGELTDDPEYFHLKPHKA